MKRKKLLSFVTCVALILSMLTPALAVADSDAQKPLLPKDSLAKTEPSVAVPHEAVSSGGKTFSVKVTMDIPFQPKLVITASGLDNTPINAAILDVKSFVGGTLGGVVTNFTDSTRFTNPAGAGLAEMSDYHYSVTEKFANGIATIGVGNFVAGKGQANLLPITIYNTNSSKLSTTGDKGTAFYRSYVFIVQSAQLGGNSATDYAVGTFVMDSEGKLLDASYMVRYIKNSNSAGNDSGDSSVGSIPANQIVAWNTAATLYETAPTRKGYDFLGWNHTGAIMGTDANAAAAMTPTLDFSKTTTPKNLSASDAGATGTFIDVGNVIYDLYAIWKPIKVDFHADTATLPKSDNQKLKVNVPYTQTYPLAAGTSPDTSKGYTVTSAQKLPKGLTVAQVNNTTWKISGTPEVYTATSIVVTIKVTDTVNKTWDVLTLTIPPIDKGAQEVVPDLDVTTGLESDVIPGSSAAEPPTADDGVLRGFYAPGQQDSNADATGSMRPYYLDIANTWNEALIYEYKPTGDSAVAWREIPLPKEYYKTEDLAGLALSMAANATATSTSVLARGKTQATVTTGTGAAWGNEYGSVVFDDLGNPTLHGLTPGAPYEVRFKENSDYGASAARSITITAGGGGGGATESGYSLLFNLMGGKVFKVTTTPSEEPDGEPAVTEKDVTETLFAPLTGLSGGATVSLPWPELTEHERLEFRKDGATFRGFTDGVDTYTVNTTGDGWDKQLTLGDSSLGMAAMWGEKASPAEFRCVTLLDWSDEVIGTAVINKAATGAEIKLAVDAVAATLFNGDMSQIGAPNYLDAETWTENNPETAVLTDKKGYNFMGWADTTAATMADTWTAYATRDEYEAGKSAILTAPGPNGEAWDNLYLKAGYVENVFCNTGVAGGQKAFYSVVLNEISRYGASANESSGDYVFRLVAKRENAAGMGVTRLKSPVFRAQMVTEAATVTVFIKADLSGADEAAAELIVAKGMSQAVITVVDESKSFSFVTASAATNPALNTYYKAEKNGVKGFVYEGSLTFINEQAQNYCKYLDGVLTSQEHAWAQVAYQTWADLEMDSVLGEIESSSVRQNNLAKLKIVLVMSGKNDRRLTDEEVKTAVLLDFGSTVPQNLNETKLKVARNALKEAAASGELSNEEIVNIVTHSGI